MTESETFLQKCTCAYMINADKSGYHRASSSEVHYRQDWEGCPIHGNPDHRCTSGCLVPDPNVPGQYILRPGHKLDGQP